MESFHEQHPIMKFDNAYIAFLTTFQRGFPSPNLHSGVFSPIFPLIGCTSDDGKVDELAKARMAFGSLKRLRVEIWDKGETYVEDVKCFTTSGTKGSMWSWCSQLGRL